MSNASRFLLFLPFVFFPFVSHGGGGKSVVVDVTMKKKKLTVKTSFDVKAESREALLRLLFDFKHLRKVVEGVCDIELLSEKVDSHVVRYTYSGTLWSVKSDFRRTLGKDRVDFKLLKVESSGQLSVPTESSSSGYYKVEKIGDKQYRVVYFQEGEISLGVLSKLYLSQLKDKTKAYMEKLAAYVESQFAKTEAGGKRGK